MLGRKLPRPAGASEVPDSRRNSARQCVQELYGDWYAPLLRYAYRATGNLQSAEDLVQEAFTDLYRALLLGKTIENPKGWTLCVVRRRVVDQQREQARHGGSFLSITEAGELAAKPSQPSPAAWEDDRMTRLLAVLSSREEEVLLLRAKGLKYRQIADSLRISTNSVKTLLARAIRKMQGNAGDLSQTRRGPTHDGDAIPETLQ
jgi:RNA polymerase sigma-70 factor (ECF subfamily)